MDDERAILRSAAGGDREAFGYLAASYGRRLYGFIYGIVGNEHDSLDIAQDTLLKAYKNMASFDINRSFVTWLFTIAKNTAYNYLKKRNKDNLKLVEGQYESIEETAGCSLGPEDAVIENLERKRLIDAIERLPEKYRIVIYLKYISGLSYREIGKRLGIRESLVESRIYTARQKIILYMNEGE
jgi:RNA polymerase sigma-70 factor (ECF subfamily)